MPAPAMAGTYAQSGFARPEAAIASVPAPQTIAQNPTLRWAAPAAALVVATAIVLCRALRRRR
ncbi:hypothetical protein SSP24_39340 [Streptomyces spinoverrucosus]|uniref:Carbon monoxide dehydrogenase subunit G n=2 Tax=Streptomyces spinoverrucosus TaxID=284043 RepID=A0A4Y3VKY3_9ACTN|nr:hypothetical protein SSP24_39340 [Streptomyces spinoverrucosus]GHB75875.1 hypothetical protein GCM10010397_52910 [Streptomyces spinoverrucosus]